MTGEGESGFPTSIGTPQDASFNRIETGNAIEIARRTRAEGMGALHGYLWHVTDEVSAGSFTAKRFLLGEEIESKDLSDGERNVFDHMLSQVAPPDSFQKYRMSEPDALYNQCWMAAPYAVPGFEEVETRGFIRKKTTKSFKPYEIHGKKGEQGWVSYAYFMLSRPNNRPGESISLFVVVPHDIAQEIDKQVETDPLFPDKYFQALYPGLVGPDPKKNICRARSDKLVILDKRNGINPEPVVRQYPVPIEY